MKEGKKLIILHSVLMCYSLSSVLSKFAAAQPFLGIQFCLLYGGMIGLLGMYALAWQQIIKHLPLTTAFANKAVTVVWGFIWGTLVFHESVTLGKLVGMVFVIAGVVLFSLADQEVME